MDVSLRSAQRRAYPLIWDRGRTLERLKYGRISAVCSEMRDLAWLRTCGPFPLGLSRQVSGNTDKQGLPTMNLAQDPARLIVLLLSVVMLGIVGYGFASGNLDAFLAALFSDAIR